MEQSENGGRVQDKPIREVRLRWVEGGTLQVAVKADEGGDVLPPFPVEAEGGVISCKWCRWWDSMGSHTQGYCHRRAPVITEERGHAPRWPETTFAEFCGEFQRKATEDQSPSPA